MYRSVLITLLLLGGLGVSSVEAHDASLHKGKPTTGEVMALTDDGFTLKTATGTATVTLRDETQFERGNKKATRQELHQGDRVTVFGTKLPGGEVVAREVLLPTATESDAGKPSSHQAAEHK